LIFLLIFGFTYRSGSWTDLTLNSKPKSKLIQIKNIGKSVRYTRRPSTVKRNFAGLWRPSRVALLSSTCCTVSPQTYCAVSSLSPIGNINRRFCTVTHTHTHTMCRGRS